MTNRPSAFEPVSDEVSLELEKSLRMGTNHSLPLRYSDRKFLFLVIDLFSFSTGIALAVILAYRSGFLPERFLTLLTESPFSVQPGASALTWSILLVLIWFPVASAFGAYEHQSFSSFRAGVSAVGRTSLISAILLALVPFATPFIYSRFVLFSLVGCTVGMVLLGRLMGVIVLGGRRFEQRLLIVGAGWSGRTILDAVGAKGKPGYSVVGYVDDDPAKLGLRLETPTGSAAGMVLGNRFAIRALIENYHITTIVLAITHKVDAELTQLLLDCLEHEIEIVPMPVLYEQLTGRVPVEHVGDNWYLSLPITHRGGSPLFRIAKRLMDIALAGLGLVVLLPFSPLIALLIVLESPGPVFYTQERLGRGGRRFRVWKFRSMRADAEKEKAVWAEEDDPRVTRIGYWLRKTHLDEFPQFWNILMGDMSAVGPRPERPAFVEELERSIPFYRTRLMVKPGMAGWGLVHQGYGASEEDALVKLQYDLYYIKHQSILLDINILLKTLLHTMTFRGR